MMDPQKGDSVMQTGVRPIHIINKTLNICIIIIQK